MENKSISFRDVYNYLDKMETRAYELAEAKGINRDFNRYFPFYITGYDINGKGFSVSFREHTRHDQPERCSIEISKTFLEMTDEDWKVMIDNLTEQREQKDADKRKKEEEYQLKKKREQLEKLKEELGE